MQLIIMSSQKAFVRNWVLFLAVKKGSKLLSYSGHEIKTLGKSDVAVDYKGRYHVIEFQVVDVDVIPVLGLQTATDLQLIQRLCTAASSGT